MTKKLLVSNKLFSLMSYLNNSLMNVGRLLATEMYYMLHQQFRSFCLSC